MMIADANAVVSLPDSLNAVDAAPLLCAGVTTYNEDTLSFSVLENVRAMIEAVPLERAAEAYARMMRNEARFRIVLTTGQ